MFIQWFIHGICCCCLYREKQPEFRMGMWLSQFGTSKKKKKNLNRGKKRFRKNKNKKEVVVIIIIIIIIIAGMTILIITVRQRLTRSSIHSFVCKLLAPNFFSSVWPVASTYPFHVLVFDDENIPVALATCVPWRHVFVPVAVVHCSKHINTYHGVRMEYRNAAGTMDLTPPPPPSPTTTTYTHTGSQMKEEKKQWHSNMYIRTGNPATRCCCCSTKQSTKKRQ